MTTRREFISGSIALGGTTVTNTAVMAGADLRAVSTANGHEKRPFLHVCDLYRPHNDPDDHWDLATAYALASQGNLDLKGIIIDNPVNLARLLDEPYFSQKPQIMGSFKED